jgi:putative transposase
LYSAVITDGFSMKEVSQSLWLGKSTNDNAYGSFKTMLEYKLKEQGKQMIKAPAELPISITCSCCKQPDRTVALDKEEWQCGFCGAEHNREYNAVTNLLAYGLEQLELA